MTRYSWSVPSMRQSCCEAWGIIPSILRTVSSDVTGKYVKGNAPKSRIGSPLSRVFGRFCYLKKASNGKNVQNQFQVPFTASVRVKPRVNAVMTLATWRSLKTMETDRIAPEWGCNPFWSDSIDFNESIISVIAALILRWRWRLVQTSR